MGEVRDKGGWEVRYGSMLFFSLHLHHHFLLPSILRLTVKLILQIN